ncbi:hypothetical protein [Streptomyces sp. NBC_00582]|uniref:hypothetical protein n=1 Tax=Streptomyces sp. NBC_00582 TaxID=2975783 RepID=UPI002E7FD739|nr:hypothetical protein [Streptomyces sp. NBC_00582]WUB68378.1 hypothetical protein OG852_49600 [Streptomyces sp. NBC_00582]
MADAGKKTTANKTTAKKTTPRRPSARAGGAFAALAKLSDSGKLNEINHSDESAGTSDRQNPVAAEAPVLERETPEVVSATASAEESLPAQPAVSEPRSEAEEPRATPVVPGPSPSADAVVDPGQGYEAAPYEATEAVSSAPQVVERAVAGGLGKEAASLSQSLAEPASASSGGRIETSAVVEHQSAPDAMPTEPPVQASAYGAGREVAPRTASAPAFPTGPGLPQVHRPEALPPVLAQKVQDLPHAYMHLAASYREAKSAHPRRPARAKRNVRLHTAVSQAVTRQMVADKRRLGLRDLKPSHYVDAALTYGRAASVDVLIDQAAQFRDNHLGEDDAFGAPNHYTISSGNDQWLDDMLDEMALAQANGLHGYMINVIVQAYLRELEPTNLGND